MLAAVVQLSSNLEIQRNLDAASQHIAAAASAGANLVVLPEVYNRRGGPAAREFAEDIHGLSRCWASQQAQEHRIFLVAGSMLEKDGSAVYNTSLLFGPQGELLARYRKIHLFDLDLPDTKCRESDSVAAGGEVVTAVLQLSGEQSIGLGLTICYDLRFAGLFEKLTTLGARIITVPSAFTEKTGRDHWEVLLRARAIENQVFILAANQFGTVAGTPTSYGRSMIIDPWGTVLAQAADGEGFAIAVLDLEKQLQIRQNLPCLQHRRNDLYRG